MSSLTRTSLVNHVLSAAAMQEADRATIEDFGVDGRTLMESAGREATRLIRDRLNDRLEGPIQIFCGRGNNGGDGLVIARYLASFGHNVRVVLMGSATDLSPDAAANLELLKKMKGRESQQVKVVEFDGLPALDDAPAPSVQIDALLGTGLTSEVRSPFDDVVSWINRQDVVTIAIDMPTGLHTDTGAVMGAAVKADVTVTMAALKTGLLLGEGPDHAGSVETVQIGIPPFILRRAADQPECAAQTTDRFVRAHLPTRDRNAYKYSVGFALLVAGSPGMTGAPVMTSTAAARAGAGYVTCACPAPAQDTLATHFTEITTLGLPTGDDGALDADAALETLSPRLQKAQALGIGPGLGRKDGTASFVRRVLQQIDLPTVIDADALNALSDDWLRKHGRPQWILTPHAGEFSRLAPDADLSNRLREVRNHADRWKSILLLKGSPAIVAAPDGAAFIASGGNAALATAGTGDVLTGLCTGFCAQGVEPIIAAACALHIGGACAESYAKRADIRTMLATDLLKELPEVLRLRFSSQQAT